MLFKLNYPPPVHACPISCTLTSSLASDPSRPPSRLLCLVGKAKGNVLPGGLNVFAVLGGCGGIQLAWQQGGRSRCIRTEIRFRSSQWERVQGSVVSRGASGSGGMGRPLCPKRKMHEQSIGDRNLKKLSK